MAWPVWSSVSAGATASATAALATALATAAADAGELSAVGQQCPVRVAADYGGVTDGGGSCGHHGVGDAGRAHGGHG